jgi:hypothetical protein
MEMVLGVVQRVKQLRIADDSAEELKLWLKAEAL